MHEQALIDKETMYSYDNAALSRLLGEIIKGSVSDETWLWLIDQANKIKDEKNSGTQLNLVFAALPRKTGKELPDISEQQLHHLAKLRAGFTVRGWSVDRISRVWLLLQLDHTNKDHYVQRIEDLFKGAEMNELVAMYSALPLLAYPREWRQQCAEGIRSNIGSVLQSLICSNPYPSEYLEQAAWNQLVMKAFFTEQPIHLLIGLDERVNEDLSSMTTDYAHERKAAGRPVPLQLWRCIGPFISERNFADVEYLFNSNNPIERNVAGLACAQSSFAAAHELLNKNKELQSAVQNKQVTWGLIAKETNK